MDRKKGKCAGIEVGSRELHIAIYENGAIARAVTEALPEGLVRDGQVLSFEMLSDLLKAVRKRERIRVKDAVLVLPSALCYCRRFTTAPMSEEQLKFNLPYEFHEYITEAKENYFYDYAVVEDTGDGLDLMAAAAPKRTVADYADALRRGGFRLRAAIPGEMALVNLARGAEGEGHSHCILDLGYSAVRLYMFDGDRFENLRTLDYGLSSLDAVIAEHYNVDAHVAASYRESGYEDCLSLPRCRDLYNAIAVEVLKAVNFQRFSSGGKEPEHIHCCGGGVTNPELLAALSATLGLPVLDMKEFWPSLSDELAGDASLAALAAGAALQ